MKKYGHIILSLYMPFALAMTSDESFSSTKAYQPESRSSLDVERAEGSTIKQSRSSAELAVVVDAACEHHQELTGRTSTPELIELMTERARALKEKFPDQFSEVHRDSTERSARKKVLDAEHMRAQAAIAAAQSILGDDDNLKHNPKIRSMNELYGIPPLALGKVNQSESSDSPHSQQYSEAQLYIQQLVTQAVHDYAQRKEDAVNKTQKQRNWAVLGSALGGVLTIISTLAAIAQPIEQTFQPNNGSSCPPCFGSPTPSLFPNATL